MANLQERHLRILLISAAWIKESRCQLFHWIIQLTFYTYWHIEQCDINFEQNGVLVRKSVSSQAFKCGNHIIIIKLLFELLVNLHKLALLFIDLFRLKLNWSLCKYLLCFLGLERLSIMILLGLRTLWLKRLSIKLLVLGELLVVL